MRVLRSILLAVVAGSSSAVLADAIDINLNNDTIQAAYITNWRAADLQVGALYNNNKDAWVADVGLLAMGNKQVSGSRSAAGLGGKIYAASVGSQDLLALGLGGQFRVFPTNGQVGIGGYAFYAPNIVTMVDGKKFWEAGLSLEYEVVKNSASVYIGYRKVRADFDNGGHATLDSGGHAGVRINF